MALTRSAASLLDAPMSGLYQYNPHRRELTVVADLISKYIGVTLKAGEGVAGQLIVTDLPYL